MWIYCLFQYLVLHELYELHLDEKLLKLLLFSVENFSFLCYGFTKHFTCQVNFYYIFFFCNFESYIDCELGIFKVVRLKKCYFTIFIQFF